MGEIYASASEAKRELGAYFRFYNTGQSHQARGYWTPAEVFYGDSVPRMKRQLRGDGRQRRCWYHRQERRDSHLIPHQSLPINGVHLTHWVVGFTFKVQVACCSLHP